MQRILLIVIVALFAAGAYLFLTPVQEETESVTSRPQQPVQASNAQQSEPSQEIRQQAEEHIKELTHQPETPLNIEAASHFVTADQLLKLPLAKGTTATLTAVEPTAATSTTVPATEATAEAITASPLLSDTTHGAKTAVVVTPVIRSNAPTTSPAATTPFASPLPAGSATVISGQIPDPRPQIRLQELLDNPEDAKDRVFYIHAVNDGDQQGLWGILQTGLIRTYAQGLSLPEIGEAIRAEIPADADEKLADKRSSFLGKLLDRKVKETYVYNYQQGRLGQNPDLILPGQQLVLVSFTNEELTSIYYQFVNQSGTTAE